MLPECLMNVCQRKSSVENYVGERSHGGQKKRYKNTLKAALKDFNIPTVMGTDCTGLYKVAGPHKKLSW